MDCFDELAKYTHTVGNYMPCPSATYNGEKGFGRQYADNVYEFMLCEENRKKYGEWFAENQDTYKLKGLLDSQKDSVKRVPDVKNAEALALHLEDAVQTIKSRGKELVLSII